MLIRCELFYIVLYGEILNLNIFLLQYGFELYSSHLDNCRDVLWYSDPAQIVRKIVQVENIKIHSTKN